MMRSTRMLPNFPVAMAAITLGTVSPMGWAEVEIPFAEAEIFFELNNTDGDLGIHFSIDGEGWKRINDYTKNVLKIQTLFRSVNYLDPYVC